MDMAVLPGVLGFRPKFALCLGEGHEKESTFRLLW
jgi:hypothetical protein